MIFQRKRGGSRAAGPLAAIGVGVALLVGVVGEAAAADAGLAFKQAIDSLAAGPYWSRPFVENALSTRLAKDWENEYTTSYTALSGRFNGLPIAQVELRCSKRRARDCLLHIDLAKPGPPTVPFVRAFWPQAVPTPSSPHSRNSPEYWTIERGPDRISVSNPYDATRITGVGIALNTQLPAIPMESPPPPLPPIPEKR